MLLSQAPGFPSSDRRRAALGLWARRRLGTVSFWSTLVFVSIICGGVLGAVVAYRSQAGQRICGRSDAHLLARETLKARSLDVNSHQIACFDSQGRVTVHELDGQ